MNGMIGWTDKLDCKLLRLAYFLRHMSICLYVLVTYMHYEERAPAASILLMQVKLIRKHCENAEHSALCSHDCSLQHQAGLVVASQQLSQRVKAQKMPYLFSEGGLAVGGSIFQLLEQSVSEGATGRRRPPASGSCQLSCPK